MKPALRRQAVTASWWRRFAGPGDVRDSNRPIAHGWPARTCRVDTARRRIAEDNVRLDLPLGMKTEYDR